MPLYGYIRRDGTVISEPRFRQASGMTDKALVWDDGSIKVILSDGTLSPSLAVTSSDCRLSEFFGDCASATMDGRTILVFGFGDDVAELDGEWIVCSEKDGKCVLRDPRHASRVLFDRATGKVSL